MASVEVSYKVNKVASFELLDFLKQHGLEHLKDKYSIKVSRHNKYNNLVLLKYHQLNTPKNIITNQCRGIILDEADNWRVISRGYDRFFNYGENNYKSKIDWSTSRIYEKLDGSLMTLYHYDNQWHIATSGTPDASGPVNGHTSATFKDLFWKVWHELGYRLPDDTNVCYMFELLTPYNRVVVVHKDNRIVLHGARGLSDFRELNPVEIAKQNNWESVKTYSFDTWGEVLEASKELDPFKNEGFVVVDANFNRVKIKNYKYVWWARMADTIGTKPSRRILEFIADNENDEFLAYLDDYPEYTRLYIEIRARFERLLGEMEGFWEASTGAPDRKAFAQRVKHKKYSGILFAREYDGVSFRDSIKEIAERNIKTLEAWLDTDNIKL